MLTFGRTNPNGQRNTGGRRSDSAAFCIFNANNSKDYAHEAHLPTQQPGPRPPPRFPSAHVNRQRPCDPERPSRAWPQKAVGLSRSFACRVMRGYSVITKRSDFLAANRGKRYATPGFVLLVFDRRDDDPAKRLGITITKKVGNAVIRNRMRRRFRALARELLDTHGKAGADHILIGRDGGIERDFATLRGEMAKALEKLCTSSPERGGGPAKLVEGHGSNRAISKAPEKLTVPLHHPADGSPPHAGEDQ
jgi:ribonuclease P protein component